MRDDILDKWSDFRFQVRKNYIQWLFPLETDTTIRMTPGLRYKFQKNHLLRRQVIRSVLRFMSFLGYTIKVNDGEPVDVIQIKPINREENNVIIGLYNPDNYPRITRILTFLNDINMHELGAFFFLMLCRAMQEHPDLKHLIDTEMVLQKWMKTQPYLKERGYEAQEALLGEELEDWEKFSDQSQQEHVRDAWD